MKQSKWPLRALLFCALIFLGSLFYFAPWLPDRLATHFDGAGHPNGWMTRNQHLLFLSLLGFGLPAFISGLCYCIRFFPASMLNVPHPEFWRSPENYPTACRMLLNWSYAVGAVCFLWTTLLNYQLAAANRLSPPNLSAVHVLMGAGLYITCLGLLILVLVRAFYKVN